MCSRLALFFTLIVEVAIDPYCLLAGIPQYSETVEQEETPPRRAKGVQFKAIKSYLLSSVRAGIGGCKYFATHGFDFSKGSILYVITHELLGSHKIGITNEAAKEKRLKKHEAEGWLTYKTVYFENGNDAFEIEQKILTWWRTELGLPIYLSSTEMPQGGHTETVDSNEIDLMEIGNQIEELMAKLKEEGSKSSGLKTTMPKRQKSK
jgi:hypothetical protein